MRWPFVTRRYAEFLEKELGLLRDDLARQREVNERLVGSALVARGIQSPFAPPPAGVPPRPVGRKNAETILRALEAEDAQLVKATHAAN